MGNLVSLIYALLFVCSFSLAHAQEVSVLKNPNFESRTAQWSRTGAGTFTIETTSPLEGLYSAKWNPSATGEFFRSSTYTIPAGLRGGGCLLQFRYLWDTGTSGHIVANVDDGTNNIATVTLEPTTGGISRPAQINFTCPASGTMRVELESTANATEITLDSMFLGTGRAILVAGAYLTDSVPYTLTIGATTTAPTPGGTTFNRATWRRVGDSMEIRYNYRQTSAGSSGSGQYLFPIPAGYTIDTNKVNANTSNINSLGYASTTDTTNSTQSGYVAYYDTTRLQLIVGNSALIHNTVGAATSYGSLGLAIAEISFTATVPIVGWVADRNPVEGLTVETSGWYFDGNIGGGVPSLGTANVASYSKITGATLDLVVAPGSQPGKISCTTGAASGATCSVVDESVGVVVNLPDAGLYQTCFDFSHVLNPNSGPSISLTSFQVVRTADGSDTIIEEGKSRLQHQVSSVSGNGVADASPFRNCGTFYATSSGVNAFKLYYEQLNVTGTMAASQLLADRDAATGQRDVHITITKMNQQMPAPIFTALNTTLAKKVESNANNERIERAVFFNNGSTCGAGTQSGSWIASCTRNAPGNISISFASGTFSAAPTCIPTNEVAGGIGDQVVSRIATTSAVGVQVWTSIRGTAGGSAGAAADYPVNLICMGPK